MRNGYKIGIIVIVVSIVLGSVAGLLVQETAPKDQVFAFGANGYYTSTPVGCPTIPQNFSDWLQILVIGNRTGINIVSAEIFSPNQVQLNLQLNQSGVAYFNQANSTLEKIDVPLGGYFVKGDTFEVSVNYFITNYAPTTFTIGRTTVDLSDFKC